MDRCLLTVKREGRSAWKDLEVPVDMPASDLVSALVKALRWEDVSQNVSYTGLRLRVDPPGRLLGPEETLEDANVKDGAVITVVTSGAEPAPPPPPPPAARAPQPRPQPSPSPGPRTTRPTPGGGPGKNVPSKWQVLDDD